MKPNEVKALQDIEVYGCHILHVLAEDDSPPFCYSMGIEKCTGQPELIITGLKRELTHGIINEYNNRIKNGETFEADRYYDGFLKGFPVLFKKVDRLHYAEYFGWAQWLYGRDHFSALQLIYPTTAGVWPWEAKAIDSYLKMLPRLYRV
ncbi:protein of unknown function [Catalinimonas alkaloidigena]|uniref:DUF4262 domain-containing protein n=1 Tax=Catalinimonas alkaloidigena TaxID=1075417 RepID=A0A1G8WBH8_9BACT|nr:DUF4262 domain-containing protein [Catalinimonas alkaloidigena]SDJ75601.1 protein of unknown function [Catalinimonas alkaloidigena]